MACRFETDPEEVIWVYPRSSTFAIWLDSPGHFVPIVVVARHMHMVCSFFLLYISRIRHANFLLLYLIRGFSP